MGGALAPRRKKQRVVALRPLPHYDFWRAKLVLGTGDFAGTGGALPPSGTPQRDAIAITALAKPRWGYIYEDVKRRGLDLLFAVDTSRSMLSNDVAPNRLQRVKLAVQDLINELQGDRVGLIAFAGRAFLQAPL